MKKCELENGVKFLYKQREGAHTSFCIALEAGANSENQDEIGVAHALEHFVFKGFKAKDGFEVTEEQINEKLDELFGFNNAMTNFPYVIYYGTTSNEDFKKGFNLYSNMILNPLLSEVGFEEEMNVIKQESIEWQEELEQYCEDLLLNNYIVDERIKEIIIGKKQSLDNINLEKIKKFYKDNYVSNNMVISVVSPLEYDDVKKIVFNNFGKLDKKPKLKLKEHRAKVNEGIYVKEIEGENICKIQFAFDIGSLNYREIVAIKLFNLWFGEGVSSLLYDEIRTKNGLAYEVFSIVKPEKGIKLLKIELGTTKENFEKAINRIEECIEKSKRFSEFVSDEDLEKLKKRYKLKISLELERSIVMANRMAIYEVMYENSNYLFDELNMKWDYTREEIQSIINKVLKNKVIQVVKSKNR